MDELSSPKVSVRNDYCGNVDSRYVVPAKDPCSDVDPDDRLAMAALSRTCRWLHPIVEPFLYRCLNLQRVQKSRISSLVRYLDSRPETAAAIRVLHIGDLPSDPAWIEPPVEEEEEEYDTDFLDDLSQRLCINHFGRLLAEKRMWEGFLLFQAQALEALDIYSTSYRWFQGHYADESDPYLPRLRSIAHIVVQWHPFTKGYDGTMPVAFPSLQSVELRRFHEPEQPQFDWTNITRIDLGHSHSTASTIGRILATAQRVIEFRVVQTAALGELNPEFPFELLKRHARTLKTLTYGIENSFGPVSGFCSLRELTALEFLAIRAAAISNDANGTLSNLPASLRRLTVKGYISNHVNGFKDIADQVANGSLPDLKEVLIDVWATHKYTDCWDVSLEMEMASPGPNGSEHWPGHPFYGWKDRPCQDCALCRTICKRLSDAGIVVRKGTSYELEE